MCSLVWFRLGLFIVFGETSRFRSLEQNSGTEVDIILSLGSKPEVLGASHSNVQETKRPNAEI